VPPTHTPLKILSALPEATRKKIYVVHTSAKDVTPETGLRIAPSGINNTIVVIPRSTGNTYERDLDLISGKKHLSLKFNRYGSVSRHATQAHP
jgi:hypothetical protein